MQLQAALIVPDKERFMAMAVLEQNWLTEGLIDFEYKKYLLLAYLQEVDRDFGEKKLYPDLSHVLARYRELELLSSQKKWTENSFPKEISGFDFQHFKVQYRALKNEDALIGVLEEVVEFARPRLRKRLSAGRDLYEEVEEKVDILPVGLLPLYNDEGYFMISDFAEKLISAYRYAITIFESAEERFRAIHASLVSQYQMSITNTYQEIRHELAKNAGTSPAVYALEFRESYPLNQTMLPVAKRMLVRHLSATS